MDCLHLDPLSWNRAISEMHCSHMETDKVLKARCDKAGYALDYFKVQVPFCTLFYFTSALFE